MNIRNRLLFLGLASFAILAAACGSDDGVDSGPATQASPTVAPTQSPVPLSPIVADFDSEPMAFLDAIPQSDRECLEKEWGADRYEAIRSGEERHNDESLDVFLCISGETWSRVMAGGLFSEIGELTQATQSCVNEKLGDGTVAAVADMINDLEGEPTLEDFAQISIQMIGEIIPITFCLNENERALLDGRSQFGESVSTLECLHDGAHSVGLDFGSVFQIDISGEEPSAQYQQVATDCGYVIPTPFPSPDPNAGRRSIGTPVTPGSQPEPVPILVTPKP